MQFRCVLHAENHREKRFAYIFALLCYVCRQFVTNQHLLTCTTSAINIYNVKMPTDIFISTFKNKEAAESKNSHPISICNRNSSVHQFVPGGRTGPSCGNQTHRCLLFLRQKRAQICNRLRTFTIILHLFFEPPP